MTGSHSNLVYALPLVRNGTMYMSAPDWTDEDPGLEVVPAFDRDLKENFQCEPALVDFGRSLAQVLVYVPADRGDYAYCLVDGSGSPLEVEAEPELSDARWSERSDYLQRLFVHLRFSEGITQDQRIPIDGHFVRPHLVLVARWSDEDHPTVAAASSARSWNTISRVGRLLLLGEPGMGKTTCLQRLALELAESPEPGPVPVFLRGRDLSSLTLATLRSHLRTYGVNLGPTDIEHLAERGALAVFVDGLDEVPPADRQKMFADLKAMAERFPLLRITASTRPSTYNWELDDFVHAAIAPFSDAQVNEWLWLHHPEPRMCKSLRVTFDSDPHLRDVVRSPLLLAVASTAFRAGSRTASHAALYSTFVRTVVSEWDEMRGIDRWPTTGLIGEEAYDALSSIAWRCADEDRNSFGTSEALHWLRDVDMNLEAANLEVFASAVGLLRPVGQGQWAFIHESFLDFLVADWLLRSSESVVERFGAELHRGEWRDRWLFACELTSNAEPLLKAVDQSDRLPSAKRAELLLAALGRQSRLSKSATMDFAHRAVHHLDAVAGAVSVSKDNAEEDARHPWALIVQAKGHGEDATRYADCVQCLWTARRHSSAPALVDALMQSDHVAVRSLAALITTQADEPYQLIVQRYASRIVILLSRESPFMEIDQNEAAE
jgi:hypothetical protein